MILVSMTMRIDMHQRLEDSQTPFGFSSMDLRFINFHDNFLDGKDDYDEVNDEQMKKIGYTSRSLLRNEMHLFKILLLATVVNAILFLTYFLMDFFKVVPKVSKVVKFVQN